jgi:hypothetical protein
MAVGVESSLFDRVRDDGKCFENMGKFGFGELTGMGNETSSARSLPLSC